MRHSRRAVAATLVFVGFLVCASSQAEEELTEAEGLGLIEESPSCKQDAASKDCQALWLAHYCKYAGSSRNAARCAAGRREKIEAELNRTYHRVLAAVRKQASEESSWVDAPRLLVEAQRAWVNFREAECDFVAESFNGGTLQPALIEQCFAEHAKQRIVALKNLALQYGVRNP